MPQETKLSNINRRFMFTSLHEHRKIHRLSSSTTPNSMHKLSTADKLAETEVKWQEVKRKLTASETRNVQNARCINNQDKARGQRKHMNESLKLQRLNINGLYTPKKDVREGAGLVISTTSTPHHFEGCNSCNIWV